jgi:hypothetical protein
MIAKPCLQVRDAGNYGVRRNPKEDLTDELVQEPGGKENLDQMVADYARSGSPDICSGQGNRGKRGRNGRDALAKYQTRNVGIRLPEPGMMGSLTAG